MKTYRVYAQIVYKNPCNDGNGFPYNAPLMNYNPTQVKVFSEEMEELVCEIAAEDTAGVALKLDQLRRENPHVLEFITDAPVGSVVEL